VEGLWKWPSGTGQAELKLSQQFQLIEGTLKLNGKESPIENATLVGDRISFRAGGQEYSGQVKGDLIEGSAKASSEQKWSASLAASK
jgi:hypothetical protein